MTVDPGKHVGVAVWYGEELGWAREFWHTQFYEWLHEHFALSGLEAVVCESFRLFASKAHVKIGSDFPEVKVIGVIEYLCTTEGVKYIEQSPQVKTAARRIARERGIHAPKGSSDHVKDAVLHGAFYLGMPPCDQ